ncbi:MAG: hypothetical protein Q9177_005899 [Variospora cf. flavescens]
MSAAAAATTMTPSGVGAGAGATSAQGDMSTVSETREKTLEEGEAEEEEELRYADVSWDIRTVVVDFMFICLHPCPFYIPNYHSIHPTPPPPPPPFPSPPLPAAHPSPKVGINLTDSTYRGFYNHHTQPIHPPDIDQVLHRASSAGVRKFLVTGSDLKQSSDAWRRRLA